MGYSLGGKGSSGGSSSSTFFSFIFKIKYYVALFII
jgi:hypothetical protein